MRSVYESTVHHPFVTPLRALIPALLALWAGCGGQATSYVACGDGGSCPSGQVCDPASNRCLERDGGEGEAEAEAEGESPVEPMPDVGPDVATPDVGTDIGKDTSGGCDGSCDDGVFCNGPETCVSGTCVSAGDPCAADGLTCTSGCDEASDECLIDSGSCLIDGACHANGEANPLNACEECVAGTDQAVWTADDTNSCDDGLFCTTTHSCNSGVCSGSVPPCSDDGFACTTTCDEAVGACNTIDTGSCLIDSTCYGDGTTNLLNDCQVCDSTVTQIDWSPKVPLSPCGDPSSAVCDDPDACDGAGVCLPNPKAPTFECRAAVGDCDLAENCDGAGACDPDAFEPPLTPCGSSADTVCDNPDTCDGSGSCLANSELPTTPCRADTGACDIQENCDGAGGCPANGFEPPTTSCGNPSQTECTDPDTCDGTGACVPNHAFDATPCDDGNICTPTSSCSTGVCIGTTVTEMIDDFDRADGGLGNNLLGNPWANYGGPSHQWTIVGGNAEVLSQGVMENQPNASSEARHRSAFDIRTRFQFSDIVGGPGNGGAFVLYANVTGGGTNGDGLGVKLAMADYTTHRLVREGIDVAPAGTIPLDPNTWYLMRFRFDGSLLQLRLWEDGTDEPSTWLLSAATSDVPSSRAHVDIFSDADTSEQVRVRVDYILDECGPWNSLPMTPEPRMLHSSAWTGTEMIIWGGEFIHDGAVTNTGYRYNPATRQWTAMSTSGAPSPRYTPSAPGAGAWVASRFCVWGGARYTGVDYENYDDGACYDPGTDTWAPMSTSGAPSPRRGHSMISTGGTMIVWGGICTGLGCTATGDFDDGAIYDPVADTWTPVMGNGSPPSPRYSHTAVWTGTEMIVWGGENGYLDSGARYDIVGQTWTALPVGPCGRGAHTAVWTGTEMIVWGGYGSSCPNGGFPQSVERYDPVGDAWNSCCTAGAPEARQSPTAVWTGDALIVWGGNTSPTALNTGGTFDPLTDTWTTTPTVGAPSPRTAHSAVWTGAEMLVWGGHDSTVPAVFGDGGSLRP